jgi:hypothetical protein
MFALCFIIGIPHGWRTFPNCRVKLSLHSLRAIILQMPSPWGFNSHFLVFLKSRCTWHDFLIFIFFHNHTPFVYYSHYKTISKAWYTLSNICSCICDNWFKFFFFLNLLICVLMHLLGLLHCCTPPMIIKWSIDENKWFCEIKVFFKWKCWMTLHAPSIKILKLNSNTLNGILIQFNNYIKI